MNGTAGGGYTPGPSTTTDLLGTTEGVNTITATSASGRTATATLKVNGWKVTVSPPMNTVTTGGQVVLRATATDSKGSPKSVPPNSFGWDTDPPGAAQLQRGVPDEASVTVKAGTSATSFVVRAYAVHERDRTSSPLQVAGIGGAIVDVVAPPAQAGIIATGSPGIRLATASAPTNSKQYRLYSLLDKRYFPSVPLASAIYGSADGVVPFHVAPASLVTTFASSNTNAATITNGGLATSVAAGTTTISAQWTDNGRDYQASFAETVGVADDASTASVSVTFAPSAPTTIRIGETTILRCQAKNASGANIPVHNSAWSVSFSFSGPPGSAPPPAPVTVDQFGGVTAQAAGTATVNCFVNGVAGTAISFTVAP